MVKMNYNFIAEKLIFNFVRNSDKYQNI